MKKVFSVILAMILCFSLGACSSKNVETESMDDRLKDAVKNRINATILIEYDTVGVPSATYYIDEMSETEFEVTGKVTVTDKFGDKYTGNYEAFVEYDPSTDELDVVDCEIYSLYKD